MQRKTSRLPLQIQESFRAEIGVTKLTVDDDAIAEPYDTNKSPIALDHQSSFITPEILKALSPKSLSPTSQQLEALNP